MKNIDIDIDIDMVIFENIDIDIDKANLKNIDIDIDKEILVNIDIDKISNRLEFGISNRANQEYHNDNDNTDRVGLLFLMPSI